MTKKTQVTGEYYAHRLLWVGADYLQESADGQSRSSAYLLLATLLFRYFALEAFLNHIGSRLCPSEWANEKKFFSSGRFRGTRGKLDYILRKCDLRFPKDRRPYQTIRMLEDRRHKLVHPRTQLIARQVAFSDPLELYLEPELAALADVRFLNRVREDLQSLCDQVHKAAQDLAGERTIRGKGAFLGVLGYQSGSVGTTV